MGIIIAIIGIVLIILINQYNKLEWNKILVNKGETNITNAISKKYDILVRYLDLLKENKVDISDDDYNKYKMINLKQSINKLNRSINEMNNTINHYMDNNEKLLKKEAIININKELNDVNITINGGKKYYNDNLIMYNNLCNGFPSNIVAKIKHYKAKEFIEETVNEEFKILDENIENDKE